MMYLMTLKNGVAVMFIINYVEINQEDWQKATVVTLGE